MSGSHHPPRGPETEEMIERMKRCLAMRCSGGSSCGERTPCGAPNPLKAKESETSSLCLCGCGVKKSGRKGRGARAKPEEFEAVHSHTFRLKTFKKGKHCGVCKQTVNNEGLICRVCRLACHRKCEVKLVLPTAVPLFCTHRKFQRFCTSSALRSGSRLLLLKTMPSHGLLAFRVCPFDYNRAAHIQLSSEVQILHNNKPL
ncbi:hypothetical protein Q8A67_006519 [Cirrhinus molitorella]|uniref:Phorbol-ester/DAG-type domain-containing protein n=1 Tax=Cirrhinus molitorella TaxID=172907 RepID=A0AA88TRV8_9TELE|nr:hypothetical protein Q8A67_006519 [Cirrhinus molitorella]